VGRSMKTRLPQYKTRVELRLEKGLEELLPEDLYLLSKSGVWTEEKGDFVLVRFYPDDRDAFLLAVKTLPVPVTEVKVEEEELRDYSALTHQYFRPIRIEDLTVRAPWNKGTAKDPSLIIEPGMAFGTGRHESTRLMIKIMKSVDFKGSAYSISGADQGFSPFTPTFSGRGPSRPWTTTSIRSSMRERT
jgi:ribosomal protein L11 methylase PrmA